MLKESINNHMQELRNIFIKYSIKKFKLSLVIGEKEGHYQFKWVNIAKNRMEEWKFHL